MKKIKFFNGIGGMCAFAVVALVGSLLFTSCEKEDLNATFTTEPAKATINVNVVEFPSGTALSGVAIAADKGEVSGMTVTLKAGADNSIAAQDVVISATAPAGYEAIQSVTVHVNALKAGGVATYNATLVAVKTATPEDPDQVVITSEVKNSVVIKEMENFTHTHAGYNWLENANDYMLVTKIHYKSYNEQTAAPEGEVKDVDVTGFVEGLKYNNTTPAELEIKISAWSIYRAWSEAYQTNTTYTISYKNSGEVLGVIKAEGLNGGGAQYEEMAHPSHSHAYQHGHGHGAENAGGGIIIAD
ncbi:DUF3869 domain-containing protein [Bacteroides rodentium]|uniref:DUF3869 domain-containing protein n=1 Tax=Bacteroides rodentium TaxID=691816 RepID=UPI000471D6F1|nr:DUF3869 domain-containing protein [Bacteroides rodentium]